MNKEQEDYLESEDKIQEQSRLQGFQDAINYIWKMDEGFDEQGESWRVAMRLEDALKNEEINLTPIGNSLGVKVGTIGCFVPLEDNENV